MKKTILFFMLSALGACGGGGGGSGGNPASPAPTIKLTTTNSPQVSATSMASDSVANNIGGLNVLTTGTATGSSLKLTDFTWKILKLDQFGSLQTLTDVSATYCPNGGSADLSGSSTSGTLVFSQCNTGTVIIGGSISFTASGSANNFTATATYTNFSFTDTVTSTSVTVNASLSISYVSDGTNTTIKTSIANFDMNIGGDFVHLYNMSMTVATDGSGNTTTDFDYTFESSLISGIVRVTTAASEGGSSIHQNYMDPYPNSGALVVIGDSSRARLTFLGDGSATSTVSLEVDTNGDGTYDSNMGTYDLSTFTGMSML